MHGTAWHVVPSAALDRFGRTSRLLTSAASPNGPMESGLGRWGSNLRDAR